MGQEQYDGNVVSCVRFAPETERSELMDLLGGACEGIATRGQWIKMCGCASGTIVLRADRSASLDFVGRWGACRQTRHVDTKIYLMQAWATEPGQRILKAHGDCQQIRRLSHEDHDASSCTSRGIPVLNHFGAASVCVERSCNMSPPSKCCITYPAQCMWTKPHLVIADESTNDLEMETLLWIQTLSLC